MATIAKLENSLPDPLISEITSLKAALERYQAAADTSNIHLQRQALDLSTLAAKNNALEQDNALLQKEISFLRSNPEPSASSSTYLQISEMTLALRRLSDQLESSEGAFREQAEQLTRAYHARSQARHETKGAHELVSRAKTREAQALERVRTLEFDLKKKEEERKMADLVVREYADLVRAIEGRPSLTSPSTSRSDSFVSPPKKATLPTGQDYNGIGYHPRGESDGSSPGDPWSQSKETIVSQAPAGANGDSVSTLGAAPPVKPIDSLHEGRAGLQRLLTEFHEQTERLEEEIARLHGEREILEMRLAVCEQVAADEHQELAIVKSELAAALRADKSAAKMVERYMSFSQQSTNLLQSALQTQKKRHNATVATLERQISLASAVAEREKSISERLRYTLDEMALEISRESFGRRRGITMRLLMVERERKIGGMLEKWVNDLEQRGAFTGEVGSGEDDQLRHISMAKYILKAIRGPAKETPGTPKGDHSIQAALATVQDLSKELQSETSKRMVLERENADLRRCHVESVTNPVGPPSEENDKVTTGQDQMALIQAEHGPDLLDPTLDADLLETLPHPSDIVVPPAEPTNDISQLPSRSSAGPNDTVSDLSSPAHNGTPLREDSPPPLSHIDTQELFPTNGRIIALRRTSERYDDLQAAFNDCHDALGALQSSMGEEEGSIAEGYLIAAVERLYDYCEDARVELEILVTDEARISQGYETLLSISSETPDPSPPVGPNTGTAGDRNLLDQKIEAFVNGTLPSMRKARTLFEQKLDNLMHDVAIIKRTMQKGVSTSKDENLPVGEAMDLSSHTNDVDFPSQESGNDESEPENGGVPNHFTWKTLASSLIPPSPLSSAQPPSPGSRLAQSFGSLMASGYPRYPLSHSKATSKSLTSPSDSNPLNHLGLRIAMPRVHSHSSHGHEPSPSILNIHSPFPFALRPSEATPTGSDGQPSSAPISRAASGWFSTGGIARARTVSNIHAVGFGVGMAMSPRHAVDKTRSSSGIVKSESDAGLAMERRGSRASGMVRISVSARPSHADEVE